MSISETEKKENNQMNMSEDENLEFLIQYLMYESKEVLNLESRFLDRHMLLRALMNIRMPSPITKEFLEVQDEYLRQIALKKGIISWDSIPTIDESLGSIAKHSNKISLWQGDITRLRVDAIVNAANSQMLGCFSPCHSCIDNAIHTAAGLQLREECSEYMKSKRRLSPTYVEPTGSAMVTGGYNLPSKYVIHTVGPIVNGELTSKHKEELKSSYISCLNQAIDNGIKSIAFCCISTGVFGFPKKEAAIIAIETVRNFIEQHHDLIDKVIFNVYGDSDNKIYIEELSNIV